MSLNPGESAGTRKFLRVFASTSVSTCVPATRRHFVKLKVFVVTLAAASLCVSVAVAAPPPGKGKPETAGKPLPTGPTCKPRVMVVLKGTLTGMTASALTVDVTSGNRWGRAYD